MAWKRSKVTTSKSIMLAILRSLSRLTDKVQEERSITEKKLVKQNSKLRDMLETSRSPPTTLTSRRPVGSVR